MKRLLIIGAAVYAAVQIAGHAPQLWQDYSAAKVLRENEISLWMDQKNPE